MQDLDDEELAELPIEGGSCWTPSVPGLPIDAVLWNPAWRLCN